MRARGARRNGHRAFKRALVAVTAVVLAGAAWAEPSDPPVGAVPQVAAIEGISSLPPATAKLVSLPAPAAALSAAPRGASGGDDRRLLMLMMLGRGVSGGPFGSLGQ